MCDYSLTGLPNRLAREGEELIVHRFRTGSMGLASAADLLSTAPPPESPRKSIWERIVAFLAPPPAATEVCAVCVPPGARLVLSSVPQKVKSKWDVTEGTRVLFTQTTEAAYTYRDAFLMPNGCAVLLQCLPEGMRVVILSLGGLEETPAVPERNTLIRA
ncbi:MAG: hypothetical protein LC126_05005 [Bryobacterales bacterium]|nr:hypothetical protein [Bryobacterales bacterium]